LFRHLPTCSAMVIGRHRQQRGYWCVCGMCVMLLAGCRFLGWSSSKSVDKASLQHQASDKASPGSYPSKVESRSFEPLAVVAANHQLSSAHSQALSEDGGVVDGVFLKASNRFMMLTKNYVWSYDFVAKRLHKYTVTARARGQVLGEKLTPFMDHGVLVALKENPTELAHSHQGGVLIVSLVPKIRLRRLKMGQKKIHAAAMMGEEGVLVVGGDVMFLGEGLRPRRIVKMPSLDPLRASSSSFGDDSGLKARFAVSGGAVWLYTAQQVFFWKPFKGQRSWQKVVDKVRMIQRVSFVEDRLLIQTPYSVVVMFLSGDIEHTIPVLSRRKLLDMYIDERGHLYVFDDYQLEYYDVRSQRRHYSKLPFDHDDGMQLRIRYPYLAAIHSGEVMFYKIDRLQSVYAEEESLLEEQTF